MSNNTEIRNAAENASNNIKPVLKETYNAAVQAASNIGREVQKGASEVGSAVKHTSVEAAHQIEELSSQAMDQAGKKLCAAKDKLNEEIKHSPYTALAVAFGLGVVVAALCRRS